MRYLIIILLIFSPKNNIFSNNSLSETAIFGFHKDNLSKKSSLNKTKFEDDPFQIVTGYIIDGTENKPISYAKIHVKTGSQEIGEVFYTDSSGFFEINIPCNQLLYFEARHDDYNVRYRRLFYNEYDKDPDYFKVYLNPILNPISTEEFKPAFIEANKIPYKRVNNLNMLDVLPIKFYTDELVYDKESRRVLNEIIAILKANPELRLEISSHTDGRASKKYELELSQKRADILKQALVQNDVDSARLMAKGYAATLPINLCINNKKCTEKQFLVNRRFEFVILNPLME